MHLTTSTISPFEQRIALAIESARSLLCVGLDPDPDLMPEQFSRDSEGVFAFNQAIIDATAEWAAVYKPQIAFYSAFGWEEALLNTMRYLRQTHPRKLTILDAKRGDIASTAKMYAREAFDRYEADAVTVNPFLGSDALAPFLERRDRGVVILARTSNPSSREIQDLQVGGETISERVARLAVTEWNGNQNVMLVVGAADAVAARRIREIAGDRCHFLVPGVGAQGGSLENILPAVRNSRGRGLVVNASRSIIYAASGHGFARGAALEAQRLSAAINEILTPDYGNAASGAPR
jgi:orotidine-5'-phosphate decarboxylase